MKACCIVEFRLKINRLCSFCDLTTACPLLRSCLNGASGSVSTHNPVATYISGGRPAGREVIKMTDWIDDEETYFFGAARFLNCEQALLDGHVILIRHLSAAEPLEEIKPKTRFLTGQLTLFDGLE